MPTDKQRRQAAQRHLQKQLERRAEETARRRRTVAIVATAVSVLVVLGAVLLLTGVFDGDEPTDTAAGSGSPDTVSCTYAPDESGNPNLTEVGTPPDPEITPAKGTAKLLMSTGQGDLTLTLDREKAPCAAASFSYLAAEKFFDGSPCHRMVNGESFGVLQCGDPSGTGQGGPTYKFAEEVTADTTYPAARSRWPRAAPRTPPAASSSSSSPTRSSARTTPWSAPSTRPAWPSSTRSPRRATTARWSPAPAAARRTSRSSSSR